MRKNDDYEPDGIEPGVGAEALKPESSAPPADASAASQARGTFDVRPPRKGAADSKKKLYIGIGALTLVFVLTVASVWGYVISRWSDSSPKVDESKVKADATLATDKGSDDTMKKAQAETLRLQGEADRRAKAERDREHDDKPGNAVAGSQVNGSAAPPPPPAKDGPPVITPAMRKMGIGMVVAPMVQDVSSYGAAGSQGKSGSSSGDGKTPNRLVDAQGNGGLADSGDSSSSKGRGSLSNLSGTTFAPSKAYLAPSRKYLVSHNTYTRCALYTEIVTDHPGLVDCRLTDPLYSADGSTVIADAGDRLTGEQTVSVAQGQASVFTTWTELETQSGTRARINSLGAGPMGASGTEAWIDHHYMQRFGGAVMLSFIQDTMQAVANTTQKSSGQGGYTVNNSEQNVESMASKALDNTINIPDTGHVLAGTVITVIVARDIDFSSVFENR